MALDPTVSFFRADEHVTTSSGAHCCGLDTQLLELEVERRALQAQPRRSPFGPPTTPLVLWSTDTMCARACSFEALTSSVPDGAA
jgi:hypothetical protein